MRNYAPKKLGGKLKKTLDWFENNPQNSALANREIARILDVNEGTVRTARKIHEANPTTI